MFTNTQETQYDFVVIGSGAAGAIIANRLSTKPDTGVCLLEAGPADWHPLLHVPAGFIKVIFDPRFTWQFKTEGNAYTYDRAIPIPQGRVLGGSTSINGLVFNRGQREDFDHWAALGNPGWDYQSVLPYFKRIEKRPVSGGSEYRGAEGLLPVSDIDWKHPICEAFLQGAETQGIPRNLDYNGQEQSGVGYFQRSIQGGRRMSTAQTYLKAARRRANLSVKTNAQATRILFEGNRAVGVEYYDADKRRHTRVTARREVVVSAGAVNTPKLLQLSGLGDPELLNELDIPVVQALDGVGKNLKDHYSVRVACRVRNSMTINEETRHWRLGRQALYWLLRKPSILGLSPSLVHVFWKSDETLACPDLQGVFTPASYKEGYVGVLDDYPGMTCGFWQHRPKSSGYVRIASKNPFDAPIVQPNYLAHPEDREVLIKGIKLARRLLASPELSAFFEREVFPGPECASDEQLLDFARRYGVSSYHLNGTARMGPMDDPMAVVDSQLRVHGIEGLRVVDCSVMPEIPSANICASTMMIAEKAADMMAG